MKKIFSLLLVSLLIVSQSQIGIIYAENQAILESEKQKGIQTLDVVEQIIDTTVNKLDNKIRNEEKKDQLQEKNEEIKEYLEEVTQDIKKENSSQDIQEMVEEAKKVVVLKVVSGTTEYEDVEKNIPRDIANTPQKKKDALEAIQDSLETAS